MATYQRVGNVSQSNDDGTIFTSTIQRIADSVSLIITFNKNMTAVDVQNAITREFARYDLIQTRITNVNTKIDAVLAGL